MLEIQDLILSNSACLTKRARNCLKKDLGLV